MIFRIIKEALRPAAVAAEIPPGSRIYVIGDIHGRVDLFDVLWRKIADDLGEGDFREALAVCLGDYIDRGPQSAEVVARLASGRLATPVIALRGNHEAELLAFLKDDSVLENWRRYGGLETLSSYGVDVSEAMRGRGYGAAQASLRRNLPPDHLRFLEQTRLSWSAGGYFFCHAGVRPGVSLELQHDRDLLWIREEFNAYTRPFEKIIVHGHSPSPEPVILPNRICVDTGAYMTGRLTCLVLEGRERRFLFA